MAGVLRVFDTVAAASPLLRRPPLGEAPLSEAVRAGIRRVFGEDLSAAEVVDRIVADVEARGDAAVRHYAAAIDGVERPFLRVGREEFAAAYEHVPTSFVEHLRTAAARIERYHSKQLRSSFVDVEGACVLGQLVRPIRRVGLYAPGGRAAYPSSLIMAAVPAKVAGVPQLALATPAGRDGRVWPATLVAADVAGVDEVYAVGGAQAIAAMAYGTESIPAVDKVVGPGNIFVVLAQRKVYGRVGIGSLPGPSEVVIIAAEPAEPRFVASDLLAQAEHGPDGLSVLLTPSAPFARDVAREAERLVVGLDREAIIRDSLEHGGGIVVTASLDEAIEVADHLAPEHLQVCLPDAASLLPRLGRAGAIFLGEYSPVPLGDYAAGTNHILPVQRMARFSSPLGVDDFMTRTGLVMFDRAQMSRLAPTVVELAKAEGFTAHVQTLEVRLGKEAS